MSEDCIIFPSEAEILVKSLQKFSVSEIGTFKWHRQHDSIERLNMQAILSASHGEDEFVKEFLVTHNAIPLLIFDLISVEAWVQHVYPLVITEEKGPQVVTFPLYIILYHEAILVNLLETVLYHQDAMETIDAVVIDLVDYCYRKLCSLCGPLQDKKVRQDLVALKLGISPASDDVVQEMGNQQQLLSYEMSLKCISLLRYFSDYLSSLPLGVATRLYDNYDIPVMLVELVETTPWVVDMESSGDTFKFTENTWQKVEHKGSLVLMNKVEGQLWICLYQLVLGEVGQQKYEVNTYRRNILLKLRRYMIDQIMDQMPALLEFRRYLEQLALHDPPTVKKGLILEQTPEIYTAIERENDGQWHRIATDYIQLLKSEEGTAFLRKQAETWAANYDKEPVLDLVAPPKCVECGAEATKRCSRCKKEWYCRRECQVKHWPKHKALCAAAVSTANSAQ